jgi:hypothetical protein
MTGLKDIFRSDFVPEWCAIAVVALLDMAWAGTAHFTFAATRNDFLMLGTALAVMAALRLSRNPRGGMISEYFALTLAGSTAICVLSYLCLASGGVLADARLMAIDRTLGFDWLAGYRFVHDRPLLTRLLGLAYASLMLQGLYFCLLHGLMRDKQRLREMFWLFLACGALACLGAALAPALGPSRLYDIQTHDGFMPEMLRLLVGEKHFALATMKGVVSFPSFHTSMALTYVWAFRKCGPIAWGIGALNAVMLCSVPFFGGHYLVDMIAGAAAMLLALALVKTAPVLWQKLSAASASPESAAASADAY